MPKCLGVGQVLVSIQALILVPEPYFNEPGFEGSLGTKQGNAASMQYNASIRRHTLKTAIHDQLKNRKSVFRDVILRHCLRKRAKLVHIYTHTHTHTYRARRPGKAV